MAKQRANRCSPYVGKRVKFECQIVHIAKNELSVALENGTLLANMCSSHSYSSVIIMPIVE